MKALNNASEDYIVGLPFKVGVYRCHLKWFTMGKPFFTLPCLFWIGLPRPVTPQGQSMQIVSLHKMYELSKTVKNLIMR